MPPAAVYRRSNSDVTVTLTDVRFRWESGPNPEASPRLLSTQSGAWQSRNPAARQAPAIPAMLWSFGGGDYRSVPYDLRKGRLVFRHKDERAGASRPPALVESSAEGPTNQMRIYIFKSETRKELRAFAGDSAGSKLPQQHGPWTAIGVVRAEADPPYNFSRGMIEQAIHGEGFQLWRLSAKATAP